MGNAREAFLELDRRLVEIAFNVNAVGEFLRHNLESGTGLDPIPLEVFRPPGDGAASSRPVSADDYITCFMKSAPKA